MRCQVLPVSSVRRITVHGGVTQGALPRTKPSFGETKVMDTAAKPAGTASALDEMAAVEPVSGSGSRTADGVGDGPGETTRTDARWSGRVMLTMPKAARAI